MATVDWTNQTKLCEVLHIYAEDARLAINNACSGIEAWALILGTASTVMILLWTWQFLFQDECLFGRLKKKAFRMVRLVPALRRKIEAEMTKTQRVIEADMAKGNEGIPFRHVLPANGWTEDAIIKEVRKHVSLGNADWKHGKVSGTVYNYTQALSDLTTTVYGLTAYTNPLHPDVFPGIRKMEAEVVRMTCSLFNGNDQACGVMTSGGTESIILACKAYRDRAFDRGIRSPEIVAPITAHAAFDKAAHLMHIKLRHVAVDPITLKVNMKAMRKAISKNTCMLVGSAPQFPHGVIDPLEEISQLGLKYDVPVHVDACLGGFLLPFMERAGHPLPPFDFRLPGVTSISADTHKYGSASKGSSVIMYRDESYRHYQFFVQPDWPGGIYASASLPGSRAGGVVAACWAAMMCLGEDGYVENTREIINIAKKIEKGLREIPGIKIIGQPEVSVVAFGSDVFDVYRLNDAMSHLGWNLNPLQFPSCIHICVTRMHAQKGVADQFVEDVQKSTSNIMETPKDITSGKAAIYGLSQSIPDRSLVSEIAWKFLDACYSTSLIITKDES